MPRIYALAKELKIDSKELVELCPRAGIQGKGSALASLTEEEVAKLRSYLDNASARSTATPSVPQLESAKPLRTLPSASTKRGRPRGTTAGMSPSVSEVPSAAETEDPLPIDAAAAESPAPLPPLKSSLLGSSPPASAPLARPPLTVGANRGQLRNLAGKSKKRETSRKPDEGRGNGDSGPVIRVAAMPETKQPPPKRKTSSEPAPQKPDIKLPVDAIRSAKAGGGALRERVKELEEKRKNTQGKRKGGGVSVRTEMDGGVGAPTRSRGRGNFAEGSDGPLTPEKRRKKRLRRSRSGSATDETEGTRRPQRRRIRRTGRNTAAERKSAVVVELPCSITTFAQAVGRSVGETLRVLLQLGIAGLMNKHATLDPETADLLAEEMNLSVEFKHKVDVESRLMNEFESEDDDPDQLEPRAPIVTFLGHVDHGKTSLLDRILNLKVVDGEAGGITQHIRAYRVENEGRPIAFLDTPGHEAFTEMRARGANVTDIAVLVVAADDGVMPQTEEAISHARAANVPIVVALNKMDLPGVDVNRMMQQLAAKDLLPSEWGGDTEVVKCSALKGEGIDELIETLLTISDLHEYKANPHRPASGTCLEAERHEGRGVMAKLLVQSGTLKIGDIIVCGGTHGRVKAMYDTLHTSREYEQAQPSTPVNVTGLDEVPGAGDRFYVVDDITKAREIAQQRLERSRSATLSGIQAHVSLANLRERIEEGQSLMMDSEVRTLNLIIRADVRGSIEAIEKEMTKLDHPEVRIKVLQSLVGGVSEADVHLADASDAIIISFNVVPDEKARTLARERGVEIRRYDIIYRITEDLKSALEGMLKPEEREKELGAAWVQKVFSISRVGAIAGCRVTRGTIRREAKVRIRVIRDSTIIGDYPLESLRREKDDAREVREGLECGIKLAGFNDMKEGDVLEAYKIEEIARTL